MILSSIAKLLGKIAPPDDFAHFKQYLMAIALGEFVTAVVLVIPRTMSVGLLLASSFWGGAICVHLMAPQGEFDFLVLEVDGRHTQAVRASLQVFDAVDPLGVGSYLAEGFKRAVKERYSRVRDGVS